jgi:hypothetical protein
MISKMFIEHANIVAAVAMFLSSVNLPTVARADLQRAGIGAEAASHAARLPMTLDLAIRPHDDLRSGHFPSGRRREIANYGVLVVPAGGQTSTMPSGSTEPGAEISPADAEALSELRSFALMALSRGAGVPEAARQAAADFRSLLQRMQAEDAVVEIHESRIGIEGETRICAEFATAEAARQAWSQTQRAVTGIDLVQLKIERCGGA